MKKEIKTGAILGYVNMFINIIVTLFFTPLLLKTLGQSEYGLYSLVTSIMAYFSVLDMGFGNAMIRFSSRAQAKKSKDESKINGMFLFLYIIIGVIAMILGIVLLCNVETLFAASLTNKEIEKSKILISILIISISISFPLSVFESYIVANEKFKIAKTLTIFKTTMKPMLMLPLLLFGFKSITMTIITAAVNVMYLLIMMAYSIKKLKMRISFSITNIDFRLLKEISTYSFFIFLNIVVDNVFNNTDQIILGAFCGTASVSIYAVAHQIVLMNTQCSTIISGLFLPIITKTLEKNNGEKEISDLFLKVSRIQLYIMLLILSGFTIFGKTFISIWAGTEYIDAYYIILILITPAIIPLTQNIGISILQAKNKHKFRSIVYIFIAILNILISIPLAKLYGGIGVAIGTAIANLLGQILTMNIYYFKVIKLDIKQYWKNFIFFFSKILIITVVIALLLSYIELNIFMMIACIGIYLCIYIITVYFSMNNEEKEYINKIIRKVIKKL